MKNTKRIYGTLLTLYPRSYQKAFGAEMMQTFIDHYTDVEKSQGRVSLGFWLSIITDEAQNIRKQQMAALLEETLLKHTTPKQAVSAALLFPLYVVFYAALVKASLALPHPHMSGIGFLLALATLLLLPGVLSLMTVHLLARVLTSLFPKRKLKAA